MDPVALGEDVRAHVGIPFVGAMSKMDTAFQQGFHGNNGTHWVLLLCVLLPPPFSSSLTACGSTQEESGDVLDRLLWTFTTADQVYHKY